MEYWDIYDRDKKPTGRTMKRNDWCLKDGEYHLTVLGVVARPDHKFLITKRVMTKAWAPGCWEVSGGAAQAGEESREAVLREVKEETGLDARDADGGYLFTYKRENPGEGDNYFVDVYRFIMDVKDEDLHLQEAETDGYMFATLEEIKAFAAEDKFLHYDLSLIHIYGMFICSVTEARVMSDQDTMTYTYYQQNVKPKPETEGKKGFVCKVCGYVYEGDELPEDIICPLCKQGAVDFEPIQ